MDLSSEEKKKLNSLRRTAQFQRSWKAIRNILTWKERVQHYFIGNILLLFLCFIVGGGLILLLDEGILPRSDFMNGLMKHLARLVLFLVEFQIFSVLFYALFGPGWEAKRRTKLRSLYEREILAPILQVLYPSAQIDTEHDLSPNHVNEVVPSAEHYIQSGILQLNDERNLQTVDLYAYSITKGKDSHDVTHFLGQVYSIKNTLPLRGELRIVPTEHFLNMETQEGYLGTMQGGKKIDVEDIQHNEHYNIYCTDEQSARKFLSPTVIEWFNSMCSRCKLSFYSNESRIYFANYNNRYFFAAPKDKESLRAWRIEETAIQLKYTFYFANEVTEMLYKNEGFS
ncbi:DUF3137 domain-containing protein [Oribacterium sinus]